MRVLLLANFDSSLKYVGRLAEAVAALGIEPDIRIPTTVAPHGLGPAQVRAATSRPVRYEPWADARRVGRREVQAQAPACPFTWPVLL